MANTMEGKEKAPAIDHRILAAVERNGQYLGLTEWLQKHRPDRSQPRGCRSGSHALNAGREAGPVIGVWRFSRHQAIPQGGSR